MRNQRESDAMKKFLLDFFYWRRRGLSLRRAWEMAGKTL
jgi:hypothetical protein